jgi:hypothetical protein
MERGVAFWLIGVFYASFVAVMRVSIICFRNAPWLNIISVASCALGVESKPESFFDLCQNWLRKFTCKDRVVVMLGTTALL